MTTSLIENIYEKYYQYRVDQYKDNEKEKFYSYLINREISTSYLNDDDKKLGRDYLEFISPLLHDKEKLIEMIQNKSIFLKHYMRKCLDGLHFKTTYSYPIEFRKLLITIISEAKYMLMFENANDFDALADTIWERLFNRYNSNKDEISHDEKKVQILNSLWSETIMDRFNKYDFATFSFDKILEIFVDPFNIDKNLLLKQRGTEYYRALGNALYHHLDRIMDTEKNEALKEWDQLSDEDKEFISKMILKYHYNLGINSGYEADYHIKYFKKFKSFDILEAYTFKLSSGSDWWKDKSVLSNVFAVWYACQKGQVPKYVERKFGKFKSLLSLYGYNWNKLKDLIIKDKEVIEALN